MPAVPKAFLGVKTAQPIPPNVSALEAAAAVARQAPIVSRAPSST